MFLQTNKGKTDTIGGPITEDLMEKPFKKEY